jgi:hypothetical protein
LSYQKISDSNLPGNPLTTSSRFGYSYDAIGDANNDGVEDVVV